MLFPYEQARIASCLPTRSMKRKPIYYLRKKYVYLKSHMQKISFRRGMTLLAARRLHPVLYPTMEQDQFSC